MKIAIVGLLHHPISEPFAGGMESHTWWLAKRLIDRGHEVTLFASGDSDPNIGLSPCIEQAFATHPQAQTILGRQACNMSAYASVIRKICQGEFDIVHNNALHPFLLLSAADLPIPMLTVLHTPPYPELSAAITYAIARNRSGKLGITAVSKSLEKEWSALVSADVVYNGIDVESWPFIEQVPEQQTPEQQAPEQQVPEQQAPEQQALWYGRIVPEKAPHLAIQAAIQAGYHIRFAGPIANSDYFTEFVEPLMQHPQVEYLGHLSHCEIKRLFANTHVFVNTPMWEEPYGFVYAEALATGTPVATFDSGAAGEILDARSGVTVKEKTVEALAGAIVQAAKLSRKDCRQRAETFCHVDIMIKGYERLYRKLLRRQRRYALRSAKQRTTVGAILQDSVEMMGIAT